MCNSNCVFINNFIDIHTIDKEHMDNLYALAVELNISIEEMLILIAM